MPIKLLPAISGNPEWGDIAGSLEFQSDLKNALDNKSPQTHNHNLNDLNEKSYNSLDDLPNLSNFARLDNLPEPLPCYITDGTDDYLEIKSSSDIDVSENFSFVIRTSIESHGEFKILAAKGVRSSNTGWTLFCDYGTIGFSIGDGSKYLTATHTQILDESKIYQIAVSYNHSTHQLLLGINNIVEEFDFTSLNEPVGNSDSALIAKIPASSNFTEMAVHSFFFFGNSLSSDTIIQLFSNGNFEIYTRILLHNDLEMALIPVSFGKFFWYDFAGNEHHAEVKGGMHPAHNAKQIVIPLINLTEDITLTDAIPAGYSVEYFVCYNHDTTSAEISFSVGSNTLISSESIGSDEEKTFAINHLESIYEHSDISVQFDLTIVEFDVHIFLKNQLPILL